MMFYHYKAITSPLAAPILSAASTALTLLKEEPLLATLHFLRDFLAYGGDTSPSSSFDPGDHKSSGNPPEIQAAVKRLLTEQGEVLVQRALTGMMYSFPRECFPDASGVLLGMIQLLPEQVVTWIGQTINMLPSGSISSQERERLMNNMTQ